MSPQRPGRRTAGTAALLTVLLLCPSGRALAHPVPFSFLDLRPQRGATTGALVLHVIDVAHDLRVAPPERLLDAATAAREFDAITRLVAGRLRLVVDGRETAIVWDRLDVVPERQSLRLSFHLPSPAQPATLTVAGLLFPYDPNHRTFVNVYEGPSPTQAILERSRTTFEYFAGTRQGTWAVARRFVPAGVHHILIGPDHLLFLLGLLLLGGTIGRLLLIVSGFTVAHSITLSLAALNIVSVPAIVIEPAIALSIVFVGVDNLMVRQARDLRPWIALAFGLIHGFGFANVLRAMDLPPNALGWSLVSFNVGVEIGQVLIAGVAAAALAAVRRWNPVAGRRVAVAGSVAVIGAGTFWFAERVFFSGGVR